METDFDFYLFIRIIIAGIKPIEYLIGISIYVIIICISDELLTLIIGFKLYGFQLVGSYYQVFIMLILLGIQGMVSGTTIALLLPKQHLSVVNMDIIFV